MSFGTAYATKKRCMAKGGGIERVPDHELQQPNLLDESKSAKKWHGPVGKARKDLAGTSIGQGTSLKDFGNVEHAKHDAKRALAHQRTVPGPTSGKSGFADGGDVSEHEQDADMIARIMQKRKEYARGGEVANDVGVAEADELPAEFDDLVLRDDLDGAQPVDSNEDGDADVKDDPIDRVMMKRKKDKLPRPA